MQRLFSMFPRGGPGFALLLLRVSVALTFLVETLTRTDGTWFYMLSAGSALISAFLTIGFLTPFVSIVVCASAAALLMGHSNDILILVSLALNCAALAFLGPGTYSLDSRLFGRRVVVLPPRKR